MHRAVLIASLILLIPACVWAQDPDGGENGQDLLDNGRDEFPFWSYAGNMLMALLIVVSVILLVAWVLSRLSGRRHSLGSGGLLQLIASVPLGDRRFISVLRVGTRYYLIGISTQDIRLLSELENDEVDRYIKAGPTDTEGGFARILRRLRGRAEEEAE